MQSHLALFLLAVVALGSCGEADPGREPSGVWTLERQPVSRDQVASSAGPEHCGWEAAHLLTISWPPGRTYDDPRRQRTYVKDPEAVLDVAPELSQGYRSSTTLPDDAVDTGYRNDDHALWYSPGAGDRRVYLVRGDGDVELWPRADAGVACA